MPNREEVLQEIDEMWRKTCRELSFGHSPNSILENAMGTHLHWMHTNNKIVTGTITCTFAAFNEGTVEDMELKYVLQAYMDLKFRPNSTNPDEFREYTVRLTYNSVDDPMYKDNLKKTKIIQAKRALLQQLSDKEQAEFATTEVDRLRTALRKKTRWGKIYSEISSDTQEHKQEDGANTS